MLFIRLLKEQGEKELCLVTETCWVAIVGRWCVNRATNRVVFQARGLILKGTQKRNVFERAPAGC